MPFAKIYIVLHGKAKVFCDVENGRRLLISFYEEGGMIGDLELMTDMEVASASVQALTGGACIAIPLQKENLTEVAEFIWTSYRHLLRELNRLVETGILEKSGKHYRIKDRAALKQKSRDFYHPLERDLVGG